MNKFVTLTSYFYGKYRDDCLVTLSGFERKLKQFHQFLHFPDEGLQCTVEQYMRNIYTF